MSTINALTVDVEDYYHVTALARTVHRDTCTSRESRVVGNTQKAARHLRADVLVMNPLYEKKIADSVRALGLDSRLQCV